MNAIVKPSTTAIRPMQLEDLPQVIDIENSAYEFPWTEGIFHDCLHVGYCCWVWQDRECVDAYGVMSVAAGEAHLLNLCVRPQMQGNGYGSKILTYLIDLARYHKAQTMFLEVRPSNGKAIDLYRKFGFNEIGKRNGYYPDKHGREDALIFALQFL